jgi:hypothetical protein
MTGIAPHLIGAAGRGKGDDAELFLPMKVKTSSADKLHSHSNNPNSPVNPAKCHTIVFAVKLRVRIVTND